MHTVGGAFRFEGALLLGDAAKCGPCVCGAGIAANRACRDLLSVAVFPLLCVSACARSAGTLSLRTFTFQLRRNYVDLVSTHSSARASTSHQGAAGDVLAATGEIILASAENRAPRRTSLPHHMPAIRTGSGERACRARSAEPRPGPSTVWVTVGRSWNVRCSLGVLKQW